MTREKIQRREPDPAGVLPPLTQRERMVLTYLSKGFSNVEIGRLMALSQHTIGDHIVRVFKQLDCNKRVEAAVIAAKAWLV